MNRVVDILATHEKKVTFLLWNPDGNKLATAADDENLNIWNFFALPKRYQQINNKQINLKKESVAFPNRMDSFLKLK